MTEAYIQVKICGLSTPEAVRAALDGRAGFIGLNLFVPSPRYVSVQAAARLAAPARGRTRIVAVMVDPSDDLLDEVARDFKPDLIQLHGAEDPARARAAGQRAGAGVIKALPVSDSADIDRANAYDGAVDHLMFDTRPPKGAVLPGGTGSRFDWSLLQGRRFARPWFLAGGLDPWNVAEAIAASGARAVDVSSGVERGPGLKDPALITAFLDAVRAS
jgi:phosphoribosylanthranilate isomerase